MSAYTDRESRGEVLVTGAAGFIDNHTVRACLDAGWSITALDVREVSEALSNLVRSDPSGAVLRGPSDDAKVLQDVEAGRYAAVVHQGAISSTLEQDEALLHESNVRQPLALAAACAASKSNTTFLYASSHSVYGTISTHIAVVEGAEEDPKICTGPLNHYARSKLTLDQQMVARYGDSFPWLALRYTNVFGTGETHKGSMASIISQMLRRAAQDEPLTVFADTLEAHRDYVPVENVTSTILRALNHPMPSGVYNLGSGVPVSFATILAWCVEFAGGDGVDVRLVPNPVSDRYQYWTCANTTRLDRALPGRPQLTLEDIRKAAGQLFSHFAAAQQNLDGV